MVDKFLSYEFTKSLIKDSGTKIHLALETSQIVMPASENIKENLRSIPLSASLSFSVIKLILALHFGFEKNVNC